MSQLDQRREKEARETRKGRALGGSGLRRSRNRRADGAGAGADVPVTLKTLEDPLDRGTHTHC